ncbi:MAG: RNA polymerase sigma factor [Longimicrobiales bacterium]
MSIPLVEAGDAQGERIPELVRRAQSGEREAFDRLYREHEQRVYGICLRMSGGASEAERLTQDAFVRLWHRIGSFRGESEFSSWLYRLTVNVVLEDSRSARRRSARVAAVDDLSAFDRGAAGPALHTESRLELERAIAGLPPGARYVLVMHDIEGYKHEEIAELTGTTTGSVKSQLHRARKLLRQVLTR